MESSYETKRLRKHRVSRAEQWRREVKVYVTFVVWLLQDGIFADPMVARARQARIGTPRPPPPLNPICSAALRVETAAAADDEIVRRRPSGS